MRNFSKSISKTNAAFSLLEMSLVIGIIALIIGMSMQSMKNMMKSAENMATHTEIEQIQTALQSFWRINGRLPCPAISVGVSTTTAGYGDEAATPGTCTGTRTGTDVAEGMVPFNILNLPATFAEDAWGVRYTYAVNPLFTNTNTSRRLPRNALCIGLRIEDAMASTSSLRTNNAIYVLISHGENKYGGVLRSGARNATTGAHADETQNAHTDSYSTMDSIYLARTPEPGSYDDIVMYKTRADIDPDELDDKPHVDLNELYVTLNTASPYIYMYRWTGNAFELQTYATNFPTPPDDVMGTVASSGASSCYAHLFVGDDGYSTVSAKLYYHSLPSSVYSVNGSALPSSINDFHEASFAKASDFVAYATDAGPKLQSISSAGAFTDVALTHTTPVNTNTSSVAFSPNGTYLAVGTTSAGGALVLYKKSGSTYSRDVSGQVDTAPAGNVTDVAFSPDGKYLAATYDASPYVNIYEVNYESNTFTRIATSTSAPTGSATSLSFSANSRFLAVGHATAPYLTVYSIDDNVSPLTLTKLNTIDAAQRPSGTVNDVSFSSSGLMLGAAITASSGEPSASVYEVRNNMDVIRLSALASLPTGQTGTGITFTPR